MVWVTTPPIPTPTSLTSSWTNLPPCTAVPDLWRHLPGRVDGQDPEDHRQDEVQLQECKEDPAQTWSAPRHLPDWFPDWFRTVRTGEGPKPAKQSFAAKKIQKLFFSGLVLNCPDWFRTIPDWCADWRVGSLSLNFSDAAFFYSGLVSGLVTSLENRRTVWKADFRTIRTGNRAGMNVFPEIYSFP